MARGESDSECEDNKVRSFDKVILILSAKNKKCEKMYRKRLPLRVQKEYMLSIYVYIYVY